MWCPNCGEKLEDDSVFCPECGARVWEEPEEESGYEKREKKSNMPVVIV